MEKALLISVVIATVVIPLLAAAERDPRRGLKRTLVGLAAFNVFYAFLLRVVLPRLG
jgi:formate-dependent nitrite reductase membrane component NrfD